MILLLTILSVLLAAAFLTTLIVGLLTIIKPLESVRTFLQNIAMGVRAIEQQTKPLDERLRKTRDAAEAATKRASTLHKTLRRLASTDA